MTDERNFWLFYFGKLNKNVIKPIWNIKMIWLETKEIFLYTEYREMCNEAQILSNRNCRKLACIFAIKSDFLNRIYRWKYTRFIYFNSAILCMHLYYVCVCVYVVYTTTSMEKKIIFPGAFICISHWCFNPNGIWSLLYHKILVR